jgi:hypothetical protein
MKGIVRIISGAISAAFILNVAAPAVSEYRVAADDTIASMSEIIREGFVNFETSIDISKYELSIEEAGRVTEIIKYVKSDPYLFYLDLGDTIGVTPYFDDKTQQWCLGALNVTYNNTYEEVAPLIEEFNAKADKIISDVIKPDMTELQKALKLHDYLVLNTVYDTEGSIADYNGGISAYDILICGNGVCQGYAQAYNILLEKCGIDSVMATSRDMNHAWNLVNIDNEWYHVDVTWDDPVPDVMGRVNHKYFMLSDEAIKSTTENRKYAHYNWECRGITAESSKYDDAFWSTVSTEFFIQDGKWYYVSDDGVYSTYVEATGETNNYVSIDDEKWMVWGEQKSYWSGKYASLIISDGTVYYNTPQMIYSMNLDGSNKQALKYVNPYETNGYVYGMVLKDDILYAIIKQQPSDPGTLYEAMSLHLNEYSFIDTLLQSISDMRDGDELSFNMQDTEKILPAAAIECMKDRDVNLLLDLGDYSWDINGKDITAESAKDLNLEIKQDQGIIPEELKNSISGKNHTFVELNLTHDGMFGLTASINYSLGFEHADDIAVLYYYNQAEGKMDEIDYMMVDRFGNIDISLEHASSYAVVLRDMNAPEDPIIEDEEKPPQVTEEPVVTTPTTIAPPEEPTVSETTDPIITDAPIQVEESDELLGDLTMDGIIDLLDLTVLSMMCLGEVEIDDINLTIGDVNRNGSIELSDLARMRQFVMNSISEF